MFFLQAADTLFGARNCFKRSSWHAKVNEGIVFEGHTKIIPSEGTDWKRVVRPRGGCIRACACAKTIARRTTAKAYIARSSSQLELLENMSDPRSDVIGVGSHAAHYNDTRYLTFLSPQVFILLLTYCGCMVNGSAI